MVARSHCSTILSRRSGWKFYKEMDQTVNAGAKLPESIVVNFCTN